MKLQREYVPSRKKTLQKTLILGKDHWLKSGNRYVYPRAATRHNAKEHHYQMLPARWAFTKGNGSLRSVFKKLLETC